MSAGYIAAGAAPTGRALAEVNAYCDLAPGPALPDRQETATARALAARVAEE